MSNCQTMKLWGLVLLLAWAIAVQAEQLRIVIDKPEVIAAETNKATAAVTAELWQSLLGRELGKDKTFALLEREDLPSTLKEWELAAIQKTNASSLRPSWLAADCLLLSNWQVKEQTIEVRIRVLNADKGAIEKEWFQSFSSEAMEREVPKLARELRILCLRLLSERNIHTVVSILEYENQSPFARNNWLERTVARHLAGSLQNQPGVLILERENLNQLLDEKRLVHGGLARPQTGAANRWPNLTNYFLISGRFDETQPQGQPLTFKTVTQIQNLGSGGMKFVYEDFPASETERGLKAIEKQVQQVVFHATLWAPPKTSSPVAEAQVLTLKALRLIKGHEKFTIQDLQRFCWELPPHWFGSSGNPFDLTEERKANVLRAVQYLKAAVSIAPDALAAKVFLSSLLADRQIREMPLALELAEEIGWQHTDFQARAWGFLCQNTSGAKQQYYRDLLLDKYPGTYQAQMAANMAMREILNKHRSDPDVSAGVAALRPYLEKTLRWSKVDGLSGAVGTLFELTQLTGGNPKQRAHDYEVDYEVRDDKSRAPGEALLEEMIQKHPEHAFYLAYFWAYHWDADTQNEEMKCAWIRRASDLALKTDRNPWVIGVRIDPFRIKLARSLMVQGKHKDALVYLEPISNMHSVKAAAFLIGQCAFATGDYVRALKQFDGFGPDNKEAAAWARKCQEKLGLPISTESAKPYTAAAKTARWERCPVKLPPGTITDMKRDGEEIWLGLNHNDLWSDHNLLQLDKSPQARQAALREGGVVRYNRVTGTTTYYQMTNGLSLPWITSLAIGNDSVWVGTLGEGIDVFDKGTGLWSHLTEKNGLPSGYIRCLDGDEDSLWIGTGNPYLGGQQFSHGGVARYQFKTGQCQTFLPIDYNPAPPTGAVKCLKVVAGKIWCGLNDGIYSYDLEAKRWKRYPNNVYLTSIACVANRIWFAGDQYSPPTPDCGIGHCNLEGEDWQVLRGKDGLPALGIHTMAIDRDNLVLGTYGLMTLNPLKKDFKTYNLRTSLQPGEFSANSLLVLDKEIWIGISGGGLRILRNE